MTAQDLETVSSALYARANARLTHVRHQNNSQLLIILENTDTFYKERKRILKNWKQRRSVDSSSPALEHFMKGKKYEYIYILLFKILNFTLINHRCDHRFIQQGSEFLNLGKIWGFNYYI